MDQPVSRRLLVCHLWFASILFAACGPAPPPPPPPGPAVIPPGFTTCAEFSAPPYVDNYDPGASFVENKFVFDDPTNFQFINLIPPGGQLGLQFPNAGLKITLPLATTIVLLDMGGFASAIKIAALNTSGASVTSNSLTATNTIQNVILGGPDLKTVMLSGGNNEGIVERICIK